MGATYKDKTRHALQRGTDYYLKHKSAVAPSEVCSEVQGIAKSAFRLYNSQQCLMASSVGWRRRTSLNQNFQCIGTFTTTDTRYNVGRSNSVNSVHHCREAREETDGRAYLEMKSAWMLHARLLP